MQNSTPEERGCQAPEGKKESEKFVASNPIRHKIENGLTSSDLNAIIEEIGGNPVMTPIAKVIETCNQPNESPAKQKSIGEAKKLLETFNDKLKNYPKYLTYDGSVVLCVAI